VKTVYVYQRRGCGSGCLWGCLVLIVLVSLPVVLAGGWGLWFWHNGYKKDPAFRLVAELVRHDGLVAQALGSDPVVAGIEANSFDWMPGRNQHDYTVTLEGPKGEGHLAVTSHADAGGPHLDRAMLTGPDGRRYDLLKHEILPGDTPDNSI
jgi:hypothetical protein